jgi:hypothetical protein
MCQIISLASRVLLDISVLANNWPVIIDSMLWIREQPGWALQQLRALQPAVHVYPSVLSDSSVCARPRCIPTYEERSKPRRASRALRCPRSTPATPTSTSARPRDNTSTAKWNVPTRIWQSSTHGRSRMFQLTHCSFASFLYLIANLMFYSSNRDLAAAPVLDSITPILLISPLLRQLHPRPTSPALLPTMPHLLLRMSAALRRRLITHMTTAIRPPLTVLPTLRSILRMQSHPRQPLLPVLRLAMVSMCGICSIPAVITQAAPVLTAICSML